VSSAWTTSTGGVFLLMLGLAVALGLVAVLLTYVVRVFLTVALIAGAPIAPMFHALPQTDGIARWWWRTFAACLAIQIVHRPRPRPRRRRRGRRRGRTATDPGAAARRAARRATP
jgi:hypothetical protein